MRKRNETRKFKKIRKGTKNYSTRRNKSGGLPFLRYFTSDGRLLEEFKKKIRDVSELKALLDTPNPVLEERQNIEEIGTKVSDLKKRKDATNVNFARLKEFVDNNNGRLSNILKDNEMQIEKRDFYKKVLEEVTRLGEAVVGDFSMGPNNTAFYPTSSRHTDLVMGDDTEGEIITDSNGINVYVNSNLPCGLDDQGRPYLNDHEEPSYFTSDIGEGEVIDNLVCKFCFKSKRKHKQQQQGQGGGSRRRRRTMRSRKNKTRRNGKCRACRCPGGCTRSTCPCYRGRSKPCCTKRCRSRGRGCRC
jgi:hypothetical protein